MCAIKLSEFKAGVFTLFEYVGDFVFYRSTTDVQFSELDLLLFFLKSLSIMCPSCIIRFHCIMNVCVTHIRIAYSNSLIK